MVTDTSKPDAVVACAKALEALTAELAALGGEPLTVESARSVLTWSAYSATTHVERDHNHKTGRHEPTGRVLASVDLNVAVRDFNLLEALGAEGTGLRARSVGRSLRSSTSPTLASSPGAARAHGCSGPWRGGSPVRAVLETEWKHRRSTPFPRRSLPSSKLVFALPARRWRPPDPPSPVPASIATALVFVHAEERYWGVFWRSAVREKRRSTVSDG